MREHHEGRSRRLPQTDATVGPVGAGRRLRLGPDEVVLEDWETDRAILVGLAATQAEASAEEESLLELAALAETAGAEVVATHLQVRSSPNPATYIGSGKVAEIKLDGDRHDATLIIFDDELSAAQLRNLEKAFGGRRVLDRTQLILDIFAQRATTREGKAQVELAQLRYRLPRLRGRGVLLSRLGAGIGTRGPGETALEVDRRRILGRVGHLKRDLASLERTRQTKRKARRSAAVPAVSLVGYTNAGKSTLLNQLSGAGVLVEDKLFSTLDTTVRRVELPGGRPVLLSDTVGFVRKLPHELVRAFHSTIEEQTEADLLVHVVDAASADPLGQANVVRAVLSEVGAGDAPELIVWNKADVTDSATRQRLTQRVPGSIAVSARTGEGIEELVLAIGRLLDRDACTVTLHVPYARGDVLSALHLAGEVLDERHDATGTRVTARLSADIRSRYSRYVVADER